MGLIFVFYLLYYNSHHISIVNKYINLRNEILRPLNFQFKNRQKLFLMYKGRRLKELKAIYLNNEFRASCIKLKRR